MAKTPKKVEKEVLVETGPDASERFEEAVHKIAPAKKGKTFPPTDKRQSSQSGADALFKATVNRMLRTPPKAHDDMRASDHKAVPRKKGISKEDSGDE